MQQLSDLLTSIDSAIGGSQWFVFLLLGTGLFFTLYLVFPQLRYFKYALKIVRGKFDRDGDYGGRAMVYLFGLQSVLYYKIVYVIGFFLAAILDTSLIWIFSGITIALMTIPNLLGMLWLHKEVKSEVKSFWNEYAERFPDERPPNY